jgi:hypothetical protein
MNNCRYTLEKGSKKHHCPDCNKKTFVRYIDTTSGDYLPQQYGRCDRENKCAYHINPYRHGYEPDNWNDLQNRSGGNYIKQSRVHYTTPKTVYFSYQVFKQTLQPERYEQNNFIQNMMHRVPFPFVPEDVTRAIELYRLGTIAKGSRTGAITFPFIDTGDNVRTIQVKQFDQSNHTTGTDFLHSMLERHYKDKNEALPDWLRAYIEQDKKVSCLFGEHLLSRHPGNAVALVEAPKTAVYGWLYFNRHPAAANWLWLAVYNKSSFSFDKLQVLKGRTVFVFPDLSKDGSTFTEWQTKARDYEIKLPGTRFVFSNLLEQYATEQERNEGADIADILIRHDWRKFRPTPEQDTDTPPPEAPAAEPPQWSNYPDMDEVTKRAVSLLMEAGFQLTE